MASLIGKLSKQNVSVIMLINNKTVIFDLVTTVGQAGLFSWSLTIYFQYYQFVALLENINNSKVLLKINGVENYFQPFVRRPVYLFRVI